jgi:hypothetical protein
MTTKAALLALFALWGVGECLPLPVQAEDDPAVARPDSDASPMKRSLANRVWVKEETGDLPGVIRIFLSDGTLVSDSCWETHRLSAWQMTSDSALSWNEDGMDIPAEIVKVTSTELVLRLDLKGGQIEEHYTAAAVPSVCPDMPKG